MALAVVVHHGGVDDSQVSIGCSSAHAGCLEQCVVKIDIAETEHLVRALCGVADLQIVARDVANGDRMPCRKARGPAMNESRYRTQWMLRRRRAEIIGGIGDHFYREALAAYQAQQ